MTTVREIVELPGMPVWVRLSLGLLGVVILRIAFTFAEPMLVTGWTWGHGISMTVAVIVGVDALHAGARKRWPLLLFADLILARLATGRWR